MSQLSAAKQSALRLAGLPAFTALLNRLRGRGTPVFMFHRVLPANRSAYAKEMVTSTHLFEAFLEWATAHYRFVSLERIMIERSRSEGLPPCAITFDDGWRDNLEYAFPLLQERGLPATIFLPVKFIGTQRKFWQEKLWKAFDHFTNQHSWPAKRTLSSRFPWVRFNLEDGLLAVRNELIKLSSSNAEEFTDYVCDLAGVKHEDGRDFIDWNEVKTMHRSGIEFGSHTLNHILLTKAPAVLAKLEIEESRHELEQRLGSSVFTFAYPWGGANEDLIRMVMEAGYKVAVTTEETLVHHRSHPFAVPRVFISDSILSSNGTAFEPSAFNFHMARLGTRCPWLQFGHKGKLSTNWSTAC